jgi:polyprenyl-phospho-N-acetylgalactosaminyl synthase
VNLIAARSVFIVIPAYNEGHVLRSTLEGLLGSGYSIVVLDDGSTDDTQHLLRDYPVHRLRHPVNLGQGAALQTGADYALSRGAEYIVHFDADGQHPPHRIPAMLEPLASGQCDVSIGSRFLDPRDTRLVPEGRRLLLRSAALVSALLTGVWLSDAHNGFRALTRRAAQQIRLRENGSAHATEFLDQARRARLRIREVPVGIRYTEYSLAKGQRNSDSVNILIDVLLRKVL